MPDQLRLQVYLAKCGIASRRKCEEIISQGRVSVNGKVIITPGSKVEEGDVVMYDGRKIGLAKEKIYIALHKPSKFLCSTTDPDDRPLAIDLLTPVIKHRLFYVGRLDYLTSGLIFFTNDGDFSKKMTHPSTHIEKEYVVTTKDEIPMELMEEFKKGIYVLGERFKMKDYEFKGTRCVHIILEEGKNRELRKVFLSRNVSVKKVHRIRIGSVELKGIHSGHFRKLTEREVKSLIKDADEKGESNTPLKKKSISHVKTVEKQLKSIQDKKDIENGVKEEIIVKRAPKKRAPKKSSGKRSLDRADSRDYRKDENSKKPYQKRSSDSRSFNKDENSKKPYQKRTSDSRGLNRREDSKNPYTKKPRDGKTFKNSSSRDISGKKDFKKKDRR
ncbi:pseudouridine synthase [Thiospirochaeta perfilievii]|uniref:Pseudouridine synthase n=1 Tax=Thiospirochaeta perfilievii TaxID=252967 RepID=A0A5C1QAM8_9SPIO|nr:pseudouridine synthase [Thiospirochaeta perfilievii]QEN03212.1 pseudouridine synthase [Thiospirochaeta perfilievii]